jgi:putative addiction module component (TIGR02574 family)
MGLTLEQFGIDNLSPLQRLELIGLIWDSLPAEVPFTPRDSHLRELEGRVSADPGEAERWEEVRARLSRKQ